MGKSRKKRLQLMEVIQTCCDVLNLEGHTKFSDIMFVPKKKKEKEFDYPVAQI